MNRELVKKLHEEVVEFEEAYSIEELVDVLDVVDAIIEYMNIDIQELERVRKSKRIGNGGFKKRIFLKSVE
ncbi:MAG: hypothetical protein ACRCXZ_05780 [Patescibacteria group bacterium]